MVKFLIIVTLIFYVTFRLLNFLFRVLRPFSGQTGNVHAGATNRTKPKEGNVNVDYVPNKARKEHLKGGEYIDYEEVK